MNRYAASLWGDFEELADVVEQADRWRESVGALAALARDGSPRSPRTVPETLTAELRPYQHEAFDWLVFSTATDSVASSPTTWGWARPLRCWP